MHMKHIRHVSKHQDAGSMNRKHDEISNDWVFHESRRYGMRRLTVKICIWQKTAPRLATFT